MLHNNKNSREQSTARNVRLKQKIDLIQQHSQQFNQLYFEFPEPENNNHHNKFASSPSRAQLRKSNLAESSDPRRNTIKQKIKFRIKQELWNLLKKSNEKDEQPQQICQSPPSYDRKQSEKPSSFVCVKGRSLTRFDRDSHHFKKNWSMVSPKGRQSYKRPSTERQNTSVEKNPGRRRLWSSIKMKSGVERSSVNKQSSKMNKTSFSLQKFEVMQIEPWKMVDDMQNHLID